MAPTYPKTLILRFRDLSAPDTIEKHKELCTHLGFAWWGWWAKPQEQVPGNEFSHIKKLSHQAGGLEILLFDSGKKCLYTAKCEDIEYSTDDKLIASPNKDHTPNYYSDTSFLAWFKLCEISNPLPYENAIAVLRRGHIPTNFKEVSANARKTYYETMEFFDAVVECAYRLEQSNKIMKSMLEAERRKNAGFSETD